MVPFTKEALLFGGVHGLFQIRDMRILPNVAFRSTVNTWLSGSSDEVRECAKKAAFLGTWFALAGASASVLALLGVRP
jgi:hypothetical protein